MNLLKLAFNSFGHRGLSGTIKMVMDRLLLRIPPPTPLEGLEPHRAFSMEFSKIRVSDWKRHEERARLNEGINPQHTHPHIFEWEGKALRYAFIPAEQQSNGLVVFFHGHNAPKHPAPKEAWQHFDLLAPWDTFGWKEQGSWFWGDQGNNYVTNGASSFIAKIQQYSFYEVVAQDVIDDKATAGH